jgi:hypothetical protein
MLIARPAGKTPTTANKGGEGDTPPSTRPATDDIRIGLQRRQRLPVTRPSFLKSDSSRSALKLIGFGVIDSNSAFDQLNTSTVTKRPPRGLISVAWWPLLDVNAYEAA